MMADGFRIYSIIGTRIDLDRGYFPDPILYGSYLSSAQAHRVMESLIEKEKKTLDDRYDMENTEENSWTMYMSGYVASCFTRIEILPSELQVPPIGTPDLGCDTCVHSGLSLSAVGQAQFFSAPTIKRFCDNSQYFDEASRKEITELFGEGYCEFWTPKE